MTFSRKAASLSATVLISFLIHACQAEVVQDSRTAAGGTTQAARKDDDATKPDDKTTQTPSGSTTPPATTPAATPAAAKFTMTWDVSDAPITSYKVFIVPPDRNARFPGKTDVPVQIKAYPVASLQKVGTKYSVTVTGDEIKTALGTGVTVPTAPCFTVVAVNAVGNSMHSPMICP